MLKTTAAEEGYGVQDMPAQSYSSRSTPPLTTFVKTTAVEASFGVQVPIRYRYRDVLPLLFA